MPGMVRPTSDKKLTEFRHDMTFKAPLNPNPASQPVRIPRQEFYDSGPFRNWRALPRGRVLAGWFSDGKDCLLISDVAADRCSFIIVAAAVVSWRCRFVTY